MALPPLPTGSSRNKIEFLYEHMNSGGTSSSGALPVIQAQFVRNDSSGWNDELDGYLIKYDEPRFGQDGYIDIMPLISPELENDASFVKVLFNLSTMARLSNFEGELAFTVVLADEQGSIVKTPHNYPLKLALNSTTVHGKASELGQRITANETGVLLIDKALIKGKKKVIPHLLVQVDAVYAADNGKINKDELGRLFLHGGDITLVSLGVSSGDL
ncbi:hypothetical protein [Vibrio harveyi]|uniref:hypothetical protein n=1 Tax=Vibrio harveyi TaxID=669 RepID=UPI002380BD2C|nr:hypothetical protein [Vibrio harveyi]